MRGWQHVPRSDKIGIVAASLVVAFGAALGAMLLAGVGTAWVPRLESAIVRWTLYVEFATALPFWLLLRAFDAMRAHLHHPPGRRRRSL